MESPVRSIAATTALVAYFGCTGCGRVSFDPPYDVLVDAPGDALLVLVQDVGAAATAVTTLSVTLSAAPTAGDVLVLVGAGHIGAL